MIELYVFSDSVPFVRCFRIISVLYLHYYLCTIHINIWGVDNRKGHNYQNHDFELTQLLYAIHHGD